MIWRVGIGASSLVRSSESWMSQMDFSKRVGRCPLLMKLVRLTCGGSAVTTGPLHSFIHATEWAIWIGSPPADSRRGLWVPGSCERITPTSQINSLELLFSQTPGIAEEDPARSPSTLCPFKPSYWVSSRRLRIISGRLKLFALQSLTSCLLYIWDSGTPVFPGFPSGYHRLS